MLVMDILFWERVFVTSPGRRIGIGAANHERLDRHILLLAVCMLNKRLLNPSGEL